jgi:hypothetical protein
MNSSRRAHQPTRRGLPAHDRTERRGGTPDEVATLAALLMTPDGASITGSYFLMDRGATASYNVERHLLRAPERAGPR